MGGAHPEARRHRETLDGDVSVDVLVIGGGMAGMLCAYLLGRAGCSCAVVEQSLVGSGVTQNTTAKVTAQHNLVYDRLIREHAPRTRGCTTRRTRPPWRGFGSLSDAFPAISRRRPPTCTPRSRRRVWSASSPPTSSWASRIMSCRARRCRSRTKERWGWSARRSSTRSSCSTGCAVGRRVRERLRLGGVGNHGAHARGLHHCRAHRVRDPLPPWSTSRDSIS